MRQLDGRVAVVTGAASGIGRALAGRVAAEGMRCVLADVEEEPLERAVGELRDSGAAAVGVHTDVSSAADVQALADRTIAEFGAVHVLCNNAGVGGGTDFATTSGDIGVSVLMPGLTRTRIFESTRNMPATVTTPPPSSFRRSSMAAIEGVWDDAMPPDKVADAVTGAIREQRFYILPHPDEAFDMAEQQLRWMRTNVPLVPGPGVARTADTQITGGPGPGRSRR